MAVKISVESVTQALYHGKTPDLPLGVRAMPNSQGVVQVHYSTEQLTSIPDRLKMKQLEEAAGRLEKAGFVPDVQLSWTKNNQRIAWPSVLVAPESSRREDTSKVVKEALDNQASMFTRLLQALNPDKAEIIAQVIADSRVVDQPKVEEPTNGETKAEGDAEY